MADSGPRQELAPDSRLFKEHVDARSRFGRLVLEKPSYFVDDFVVAGNTWFEEVTCVGLQPEQRSLYGILEVKQATGYGGDLCDGPGNQEYVRFFVDWDDDGDFSDPGEDVGVASVTVHDVAGPKPLCYAVSVALTEAQMICFSAAPRRVRAVLSYGSIPPAGDPNPPIVWGNVLDVSVQPQPVPPKLLHLLEVSKVSLKSELAELVDLNAPVVKAKSVEPAKLAEQYAGKVPPHRWLAPQLSTVKAAMTSNVAAAEAQNLSASLTSFLPADLVANVDPGAVLIDYLDLDGNTSYEELQCVGLHPGLSGVVAVLEQKLPSGYSGGLCSAGSSEFVSFWADWDNSGSFDEYLGTSVVRVHDEDIPTGGLHFSVFLPVNLLPHRRPCTESPVARIRAVLSWNTAPSSTNPYDPPTWGNMVDALVQLPVGDAVVGQVPFISSVGNMAVENVNAAGFATGTAVTAGFSASNAPFGGIVTVAGHISNPPNLSAGAASLRYALRYRHVSEPVNSFHAIDNTFQVTLTRWSAFSWTQTQPNQAVDGNSTYQYLEDLTPDGPGGDQTFVEGFVLGKWLTAGLVDGLYVVWMVLDPLGVALESNHVWVELDNTAPDVTITLDGDPFVDQGDPVTGTVTATDDHFSSWSLGVLPGGYPFAPVPAGGFAPVTAAPFSLATAPPAVPGGYVLELNASDRTIVNSGAVGWHSRDHVGFCIEQ